MSRRVPCLPLSLPMNCGLGSPFFIRMAFKDSSARFGFASAVATLLFIIVAILAWLQLRWSRAPAAKGAR